MKLRRRRFAAFLSPAGVQAAEYRETRGGLQVARSMEQAGGGWDLAEASRKLADLLESMGARGGDLALAATGFGIYSHLLQLPSAPDEVLRAVATREMRRFYPDLFAGTDSDPLIDFVDVGGSDKEAAGTTRSLIVAGLPSDLPERVSAVLQARGIRLVHWALAPVLMQRLFEAFVDSPEARALLLLVPETALLAFFEGGELRLFSEVRGYAAAGESEIDAAVEQVRRGDLFLRQQFRGARLTRLHVAAASEEALRGAEATLRERTGLEVEPFGPFGSSPGVAAALGAALNAHSGQGLNLLPPALRPPDEAQRSSRALFVASAALVVAASGWWAAQASRAEARAVDRVQALEQRLEERGRAFAEIRSVAEERRAHAQRVDLLRSVRGRDQILPELLWPLQAYPEIEVQELQLSAETGEWIGTLRGTATGPSGAAATRSVRTLYGEFVRLLPAGAVRLERLESSRSAEEAGAGGGDFDGVAVSFEISFIMGTPGGSKP